MKNVSEHDLYVRTVYKATRLVSHYFKTTVHNAHRIPSKGRVMLVGNHALMGVDTWALLPELFSIVARVPRGMALRTLFDVPGLKHMLENVGMVRGERQSAVDLLLQEEMVLTYPGGARDSLKGVDSRYTLQWEGRLGFAHAAYIAQAPIVPIAGVGPDNCFPMLSNMGILPTRGLSKNTMRAPLFLPLARRVPFEFFVGEPITPPLYTEGESAASTTKNVEALALNVQQTMEDMLMKGLSQRPDLSPRRSVRARVQSLITRRLLSAELSAKD